MKKTTAQKMRWIAGVLYLLLAVYQTLALNVVLLGTSFYSASFGWVAALAVIPAAVAMSIWMFAGDKALNIGARRAVVVGTAWFILFEIITYSAQTALINYTLAQYLPQLADKQIWLYFFMIFRLLLMILAAFFVTGSREGMDAGTDESEQSAELTAEELDAIELADELSNELSDELADELTAGELAANVLAAELATELTAEEVAAVELVVEEIVEAAADEPAEAEKERDDPEA